jgi:hypothetical protein
MYATADYMRLWLYINYSLTDFFLLCSVSGRWHLISQRDVRHSWLHRVYVVALCGRSLSQPLGAFASCHSCWTRFKGKVCQGGLYVGGPTFNLWEHACTSSHPCWTRLQGKLCIADSMESMLFLYVGGSQSLRACAVTFSWLHGVDAVALRRRGPSLNL